MTVAGVVNQRVPEMRIDVRNDRVADTSGEYVLYWMIIYRRRRYIQFAVCHRVGKNTGPPAFDSRSAPMRV